MFPHQNPAALLSAAVVLALLSACEVQGQAGGTPPVDSLPPAEIPAGDERVVVGFVGRNQIDCHRDAPCALHLDIDGLRIVALYDPGKGVPLCGNEASTAGLFVERGDEVEVFGKGLGDEWLSTCDSPDYYIRVLRTRDEVMGLGEERVVSGVVIENSLGCEVDVACFVRLLSGEEEIAVIYHYGEWPPCNNVEAIHAGIALEKGDRVEVLGRIEEGGEFSTCESEAYYIRSLP